MWQAVEYNWMLATPYTVVPSLEAIASIESANNTKLVSWLGSHALKVFTLIWNNFRIGLFNSQRRDNSHTEKAKVPANITYICGKTKRLTVRNTPRTRTDKSSALEVSSSATSFLRCAWSVLELRPLLNGLLIWNRAHPSVKKKPQWMGSVISAELQPSTMPGYFWCFIMFRNGNCKFRRVLWLWWFVWKLCSVLQNSKKNKGAYFSTKDVSSHQNTCWTYFGRHEWVRGIYIYACI